MANSPKSQAVSCGFSSLRMNTVVVVRQSFAPPHTTVFKIHRHFLARKPVIISTWNPPDIPEGNYIPKEMRSYRTIIFG